MPDGGFLALSQHAVKCKDVPMPCIGAMQLVQGSNISKVLVSHLATETKSTPHLTTLEFRG